LKEAGRLGGVFAGRTLKPWTICELNELRNFTREYGFSAGFISQLGSGANARRTANDE
jgi:hypothetical protein